MPLPEGWGNDSEQGLTFPVIYSLLRAMNKNYNGQRKVLFRKMAMQEHPRTSKDIQGEEGQDGSFEWVVRKSPLRRWYLSRKVMNSTLRGNPNMPTAVKKCVWMCVCVCEGLTSEGKWQLIMQSVETTLRSSGSILWISLW